MRVAMVLLTAACVGCLSAPQQGVADAAPDSRPDGAACSAPWSPMTSGTGLALWKLWGSGPGNTFASGAMGTILRFDGSAWSAQTSGTSNFLFGVWGSGPGDVFAVGFDGTIVHFNGSVWSAMASGTANTLSGVWGSGPGDVFALGSNGTIVHFNGSAWSAMASGLTTYLYDVWGSGPRDVYAVGAAGVILHFDGSAWSPPLISKTPSTLFRVWGSGPRDVYAVGELGTILHFDGSGWLVQTSGTTNYLYGVWGSGSGDVFAVGDNGTILHFDGSVWSAMTSGTSDHLSGVWGTGPGDVFASGSAGTILRRLCSESSNLVANGDFETGLWGWLGYNATLSQSGTAHGGAYSCGVCRSGASPSFSLDDDRYSVNYPRQGEVYAAQAWVRLPAGSPPAPDARAYLFLREWPSDGMPGPFSFGPPTNLDQNWRLVTVERTVGADAFGLDLFLGGDELASINCFLADDIELRRH